MILVEVDVNSVHTLTGGNIIYDVSCGHMAELLAEQGSNTGQQEPQHLFMHKSQCPTLSLCNSEQHILYALICS